MDKYFFIDSDLKSSIISCEANYTPTCIIFGYVPSFYGSEKLTVTEEYYDKLLKSYDDWILLSGFPQTNSSGYSEEDILDMQMINLKRLFRPKNIFTLIKCFIQKASLFSLHSKKENSISLNTIFDFDNLS